MEDKIARDEIDNLKERIKVLECPHSRIGNKVKVSLDTTDIERLKKLLKQCAEQTEMLKTSLHELKELLGRFRVDFQ